MCREANGTKQDKKRPSVPSGHHSMVLDKPKTSFQFHVLGSEWYWTSQKHLFRSTCLEANGTKQDKNPRPFQVATIAWYWTSQKQLFSSTCREANGTKQDKKRSPVPSGHHSMVPDKSKIAFQFQVTAGHGTKQVKSHLWGHTAGRNNETEPGKQKIPF